MRPRPKPDIAPAVAQVLSSRAEACAEFFARHAHEFKEQQDLIASHDQYGDALNRTADLSEWQSRSFKWQRRSVGNRPLEKGHFCRYWPGIFVRVTALDISPDMLQKSAARVAQEQLNNVQCVAGDTASLLPQQAGRFEFAAANMVLHHVPAPKTIFTDAAQLLAPGGTLLITDLVTTIRCGCGNPAVIYGWVLSRPIYRPGHRKPAYWKARANTPVCVTAFRFSSVYFIVRRFINPGVYCF